MILYIVRHGKTLENAQKIIMGQGGGTLSKKGLEQAIILGEKLKRISIDAIYCSNLKRAKDTLREIKKVLKKIPKTVYSKEITEINFGEYEGTNWDNFKLYDSKKTMMGVKPKDGESLAEVRIRVRSFIQSISNKHENENVLIITHGGIILMIASILLKIPFEELYEELHFKNACICKITVSSEGKAKMRQPC